MSLQAVPQSLSYQVLDILFRDNVIAYRKRKKLTEEWHAFREIVLRLADAFLQPEHFDFLNAVWCERASNAGTCLDVVDVESCEDIDVIDSKNESDDVVESKGETGKVDD